MSSTEYSGVVFPCSQRCEGSSASAATNAHHVDECNLGELLKLGRPVDDKVRFHWMRRFIAEMHWLPLIEVLSGCQRLTDPSAHAVFMTQLEAMDVPRIAHRSNPAELFAWGTRLRFGLKPRVPDPTLWSSLNAALVKMHLKNPHVLFVGDGCIAAAEQAAPSCLQSPPWLFYKAVTVGKGKLDTDANDVMMASYLTGDPSSVAYWRFLKEGQLS